jgi:hypothetical protein
MRRADDGFPTMLAFCAYTCGSIISYLCRWPRLCPQLCTSADKAFSGTLNALSTFAGKWPLASEWVDLLESVAQEGREHQIKSAAEVSSRETRLNTIATAPRSPVASKTSPTVVRQEQQNHSPNYAQPQLAPHGETHALDLLSNAAAYQAYDQHVPVPQPFLPVADISNHTGLNMFLDSDFADYMQGYVHCNFADWQV